MNINLLSLKSGSDKEIIIDQSFSFPQSDLTKVGILKLDNGWVKGSISKNSLNDIIINLNIKGTMVLPCSRSLEPVDYPFEVKIDGDLNQICEEIGQKIGKMENSIDILPIIWENILMEIPMRIVSDKALDMPIKGDGWRLITDQEEEVNPEFMKLKDLL